MLGSVVRSSLRFRLLVVGIALGVMVVGIAQLRDAPVDVLPEFAPPYAEIQTEALGLSAQEVEQFLTVPLEADMLNGVEGVEVIRSESLPGLSSIVLVFEPGTDVYRGRQLIQERLTLTRDLPKVVTKPPTLLPPLSSSSRVLMIGLSSDRLSPIDQSVIARWTIRPRLMGVRGVANVAVWGMRDQQLHVQVDPERLRDRDVRLRQVVRTAGNAQVVSPLTFLEASTPGSGGFIETPQQRLQVRNVLDRLADPRELGRVPVEDTGGRLRLSDVSDIRVEHPPLIGDAVVDDGDGLLLVVEKFPGANTLEVTREVEDALETLRPGLSGMRTDTSLFRPATYIEDATDNLALALAIGGVLLGLALAVLLFQWRAVLVALVTIPLSLVVAALVVDALGETFNAISFAGLAAALAVVVDDAVAGIDGILGRLRRERGATPVATVVAEATQELRSRLGYATLIALLAVVPIAVIEGRPGAFFEPLALSFALAILAATLVALTVAPALSVLLFSRGRPALRKSPLMRRLRPRYLGALVGFVRRPRAALIAGAACVVVGLALLPLFGTSLIPTLEDRDVLVRLEAEPGTSNTRMTQIASSTSRDLRSVPGVETVSAHVGRAVTGDQRVDVNSASISVVVDSGADYEDTLDRIGAVVRDVREVEHDIASYSTQKIRDVGALDEGSNDASGDGLDVLTGSDEPLVVRVYGQELDVLRREARRVLRAVSQVDGVVNPRVELPAEQPNLVIETDLERARRFGVKPGDVRRAQATLLHGIQVGSVFEQQKVFEVLVTGTPEARDSIEDVRNLLIDRPDGGHVRLAQVADVRTTRNPVVIRREAVSRRIDVEADVSGRSLGAVADDVRDRLADLSFPLEYHVEVVEETAHEEIGASTLLACAIVAALAAFLLLHAAFRSWRLAAVAFLTLPAALAGGLVGALLDGAEISLGALLGFLALLTLAARHSLLLIRHLQALGWPEEEPTRIGLVRRGAGERLGPVVTTTVALALLVLPLVALGSRPGLEIVHPLAVVLLGGLVTAAFVSLFVLPALYLQVGAAAGPSAAEEDAVLRERAMPPPVAASGDGLRAEPRIADER